MKTKFIRVLMIFVYLLLLSQFLYSNFVHLIGPSYTLQTQAYKNSISACIPGWSCNCVNCDIYHEPVTLSIRKGFPFTNSIYWVDDGNVPIASLSSNFTLAKVLDGVYIFVITIITLVVYKKTSDTKV